MSHESGIPGSVGVVRPVDVELAHEGILLDNGALFGPVRVRYETYGRPADDGENVVLLVHAFSGDAHAAGFHSPEDRYPGWWDAMVGPGKPFNTDRYFVVCANVLGGCQGSTGPSSVNPKTGRPYGLSFPVITIRDMVRVQARLLDHLGIERVLCVAGGSMGGMQALEWAVSYPDRVCSAIVLASTTKLSAQGIAFNAVGRNAITSDPAFNGGDYYDGPGPARGLAIARMIGHITYLSDTSMREKFGRKLRAREDYGFDFNDQFEVESYLEYQGIKFVERFDANSYLYISKAMDYFDLGEAYGGLDAATSRCRSRFLVVSFTSDWLYPVYQSKELVYSLMHNGVDVSYVELDCAYGHDSFLIETERQGRLISSFLRSVHDGQGL